MSVQPTSGKYGTIKPRIRAWDYQFQNARPDMSRHLLVGHTNRLGRWDERTTWDSCSPEHAWDNGVHINELRTHEDLRDGLQGAPDSAVYYYEETEQGVNEVVLVERDGVVTTVLLVSMFQEDLREYLRNLRVLIDE